jgi:hypothetical protein
VEIDSRRDIESEELAKRISRQASLESSFRGGQVSTSGCRAIEEEEEEEAFLNMCAVALLLELHTKHISIH